MSGASQHMNGLAPALKQAAKEAIWSLTRHKQGPKGDVFLFSTRRSGSTLLMETIAANRGVRYVDQPFSLYHASPRQLAMLPIVSGSKYVELGEEDLERAYDYLARILNGELKANAPWEFWKPGFDWVADRYVLKIVDAKGLIEQIDDKFDNAHIVYSTRHPIPTALSVIRNNWTLTTNSFLQNARFVENYLDDRLVAFCQDVESKGTALQRHVLNWTLENLIPLRALPRHKDWLYVRYEDMVLRPEETAERLGEGLGLADVDAMKRRIARPSRSTRKVLSRVHRLEDARDRVEGWRGYVGREEEKGVMRVLEEFGVGGYG